MKRILMLMLVVLTLTNSYAQEKPSKRELKDSLKEECFDLTKSMLLSKRFKFTAKIFNTNNNVVVHGITLNGNTAIIELPFMGKEFTGSGYGARDTSISYRGDITDFKLKINERKKKFKLSFITKNNGERIRYSYDIDACAFAYVNVQSDKRTYIVFDGPIRPLE